MKKRGEVRDLLRVSAVVQAFDGMRRRPVENKVLTATLPASMGALALLAAMPAQATQTFCAHSPENPTMVLGLLGAAAGAYPWVRGRLRNLSRPRPGPDAGEERS